VSPEGSVSDQLSASDSQHLSGAATAIFLQQGLNDLTQKVGARTVCHYNQANDLVGCTLYFQKTLAEARSHGVLDDWDNVTHKLIMDFGPSNKNYSQNIAFSGC
jgi:hypothetical protein